jgi:hypothetical protein
MLISVLILVEIGQVTIKLFEMQEKSKSKMAAKMAASRIYAPLLALNTMHIMTPDNIPIDF